VLIPDSNNVQIFSLPFTDLNFVLTQKMVDILVKLLSAKLVKEKRLLVSEKEPVHANPSSVDQVRLVNMVNVLASLFDRLICSPISFNPQFFLILNFLTLLF
jgi:hypothetical protein